MFSETNLLASSIFYMQPFVPYYVAPVYIDHDGFSTNIATANASGTCGFCSYVIGLHAPLRRQLAKGQILFGADDLVNKWQSKSAVYREVLDDSTLVIGDTTLQNFMDSVSYTNMKTIRDIVNGYSDPSASVATLSSIRTANSSMGSGNAVESNFQQVNDIYLSGLINDTLFDSSQVNILRTIANLCPYTDGDAVYMARAMLMPYDSMGTVYRNPCELEEEDGRMLQITENATNESAYKNSDLILYPNPANSSVTLEMPMSQTDKGSLAIYSMDGTKLLSYEFTADRQSRIFATDKLTSGVYFVRVYLNGEHRGNKKLVIIK